MVKPKVKIQGDEAIIESDDNDMLGKLISGCKGKIKINTPFCKREVKVVKKFKTVKPKDK